MGRGVLRQRYIFLIFFGGERGGAGGSNLQTSGFRRFWLLFWAVGGKDIGMPLKNRSPLKVDRGSNFEFWPKWAVFWSRAASGVGGNASSDPFHPQCTCPEVGGPKSDHFKAKNGLLRPSLKVDRPLK